MTPRRRSLEQPKACGPWRTATLPQGRKMVPFCSEIVVPDSNGIDIPRQVRFRMGSHLFRPLPKEGALLIGDPKGQWIFEYDASCSRHFFLSCGVGNRTLTLPIICIPVLSSKHYPYSSVIKQ